MTGGTVPVPAPGHPAGHPIRMTAGAGMRIGPLIRATTVVGISQPMYAITMAAMVFRNSSPASTARPNAHSRDAVNVSPSPLNGTGWSREVTRYSGAWDQAMTAVTAAPKTTRPPVTSPSLATSHLVRGTVWLQASRQVPRSSSRPSSGAPTMTPSSPGMAMSGTFMIELTPWPNRSTNDVITAGQPAPPLRARQAGRPSPPNAARIWMPMVTASTASTPNRARQVMACARCCRQVTQIMTSPLSGPSRKPWAGRTCRPPPDVPGRPAAAARS